MVIEIKVPKAPDARRGQGLPSSGALGSEEDDDEWEAFLAERIPTVLDNAIKNTAMELLAPAFERVLRTPGKVYELLPIALPKTHHYVHDDGNTIKCAARYPIDQWIEEDKPYMSQLKWFTLFRAIALEDIDNLRELFEVCDQAKRQYEKGF